MRVRVKEGKIHLGRKEHYKPALLVYVHPSLVDEEEFVEFPLKGKLVEDNLLMPSDDYCVFVVEVKAGYRGGAKLNVVSEYERMVKYPIYESERGSLGIGEGALVITKEPVVIYEWERTGRLYGQPERGLTVRSLTEEKVYPYLNFEAYKELKALGVI